MLSSISRNELRSNMNWPYIAGYFDGEGCLLLAIQQAGTHGSVLVDGYLLTPHLSISSYDDDVLCSMKEFVEAQGFSVSKFQRDKIHKIGQTRDATRFAIYGWDNILKTIEQLLPYSIAKKPQFLLFMDLYQLRKDKPIGKTYTKKRVWTKEHFLKAMGIVDSINNLKSRTRGKFNKAYFEALWK